MPSRSTASSNRTDRSFLLLAAADALCAVPAECVVQVVPMAALSCESNSAGILAGFLNFGGSAVPILHLWRLLDVAEVHIDLRCCIVLIEHDDAVYGLIASGIDQIIHVPSKEIVALAPHAVTRSAVRHQQNIVPILSIADVVLEQEKLRIAELRETQQRRLTELQETPA